jgi:hypothetical protein
MAEDNVNSITEQQATQNPVLEQMVGTDTPLKDLVVNYVGQKCAPSEDDEQIDVTVQMIVEAFSKEFPEFLMAVAEENWVRGYHQALVDIDPARYPGLESDS